MLSDTKKPKMEFFSQNLRPGLTSLRFSAGSYDSDAVVRLSISLSGAENQSVKEEPDLVLPTPLFYHYTI